MAPKAKKIYKGIKKQEKKIAKKEVKKAKTMIKKNKKWTVAASAFGYHAGYNNKAGWIGGKGGIKYEPEKLQTGVKLKEAPARSTSMFSPFYKRLGTGKDGMLVSGLQKLCYLGYDDTKTDANKQWAFLDLVNSARMNKIQVNPDAFGGTITQDAQHYEFFMFKNLQIIFVIPTTSYALSVLSGATTVSPATLDNVNLAVGYYSDSEIANVETVDYNALQSSNNMFEHQLISPWGAFDWTPKQIKMQQIKWKNTELQTSGVSEDRMCCQGIIYGFFDQKVASPATSSPTGVSAKIGDVYVKYTMMLKGRIATNGITVEISNRDVARQQYLEFKKREMKMKGDEKTEADYNKICKRYSATMKGLQKMGWGTDPVPSVSQAHTHVVIVDETYDGTDSKQTVSVTSNQLNCVSSGSGTTDVNITKVAGATITGNASVPIKTPSSVPLDVNMYSSGGVTVTGLNPLATTIASVTTGSGNIPIDIVKVGGGTGTTAPLSVAVVGSASTELPINLTQVNSAALVNTSNPSGGGAAMNSAIPVQIWGYGTTGSTATEMVGVVSGSGTSAHTTMATFGWTASKQSDTQSVSIDPPSPTESLDTVIVKKKDYKEALTKGIKLQLGENDKKVPKGPKGPSEEEIPDIEDTASTYADMFKEKHENERMYDDAHYGNISLKDYLARESKAVLLRQKRAQEDPTWMPEYIRRFNGYMEVQKYQKGYGHLIPIEEIGSLFDG